MICGDMNIAPTDEDVFDTAAYVGHTHVTAPERRALAALEAVGLHDVVRARWPGERVFTYCDYAPGCSTRTSACASTSCSPGRPVAARVR